ncbi:MAG: HAD hydrolase-like protein [Actinomycetota bacterium]|nr:HAD hydrolase-like protein [Actinomycetota bacterium]
MTIANGEHLGVEASEDSRLLEALVLLEREHISVLSLDMFDTLVWRLVPEPTDAFVLLGHRLRTIGQLDAAVSPELFGRLRQRAELRARGRLSPDVPPEVTLEQVYREFPPHLFAGTKAADVAAAEVAFDKSITFPDLEITRLARLAQDKLGARLVVVSDTYYSPGQLRTILDRQAFEGLAFADVLTSSQHEVSKGSGLFRRVLEVLSVRPEEVLHVGDNAEADVASARKEGIHAVHFDRFPHSLATVLEREGVVRRQGGSHPPKRLDNSVGDLGLTALRAKAVCRSEDGHLAGAGNPYWRFGASVLGPVFTGYAEWVHARAQQEGHTTVYCVMREGEFLGRLIDGARRYLGSDVGTKPLWLSRHVCTRAAIFDASGEELAAFLERRQAPTLRGFCESLGIGLGQLPELFNAEEGRLDDPDLRERAIASITSRPDLQASIVTNSAKVRKGLVEYFLATVGDSKRVLLTDLGWGGTIQAYLELALRGAGVDVQTHGLYLLTTEGAGERMLDGVRLEGFLSTGGRPDDAVRWIVRSPEILEQVCMVDQGSLVDVTPEGLPVQAPVRQSPVQMLQRNAVQRGIVSFQQEWGRYHDVVPAQQRALAEDASDLLLQILLRFVLEPTAEEAAMFRGWLHDEDYGAKTAETVITDDLAPILKYMTLEQFLALPMTRLYWPFGLAALYNRPLTKAARAAALGVVPTDAFMPVEEVEADLYLDVGGGYRRDRTTKAGPNNNGLCFIREQVTADAIRGIKVGLGAGPGVARIDAMTMVFRLRGRAEPVKVEIQWPEQFDRIGYESCAALSENLLFGSRNAPHITYRCPPEWGGDVYKLELELAFASLPIAAMRGAKAATTEIVLEATRRLKGKLRSLWLMAEGLASERARPVVRD